MLIKILGYFYGTIRSAYYRRRYIHFRAKYDVQNFRFKGAVIQAYDERKLFLSEDFYIGPYSTIKLQKFYKTVIWGHCQIPHNVRFYKSPSVSRLDFAKLKLKVFGTNVFINRGIKTGYYAKIGSYAPLIKKKVIAGVVMSSLIHYKEI